MDESRKTLQTRRGEPHRRDFEADGAGDGWSSFGSFRGGVTRRSDGHRREFGLTQSRLGRCNR
ncbi:MAG: hypothetical protein AAF663_08460 [Planctomycetota bacterium]